MRYVKIFFIMTLQRNWIEIYHLFRNNFHFIFLAYLFWIINYILIVEEKKKQFYRFITADLLSRTVCFLFFIFLPTTNVRPELQGNSIWIGMVKWLYKVDEPANLFPSIHCLVSWFCVIGIKNRMDIPNWYKGISFVFALLICISTQTLKTTLYD